MARQDWKSSRSWAASFADLGSSSNVTKTSSTSIEMLSPNDGWAVGYQGLIRKDHNGWHVYPIITTGQLNLISMTSTSDGWLEKMDSCSIGMEVHGQKSLRQLQIDLSTFKW